MFFKICYDKYIIKSNLPIRPNRLKVKDTNLMHFSSTFITFHKRFIIQLIIFQFRKLTFWNFSKWKTIKVQQYFKFPKNLSNNILQKTTGLIFIRDDEREREREIWCVNLRDRLSGIIWQFHLISLDFLEALLTINVSVRKEAILSCTVW